MRHFPRALACWIAVVALGCQRPTPPGGGPAAAAGGTASGGTASGGTASGGTATGPATTAAAATVRLTVRVADLRNRTGNLVFGVFRSADGFPSEQGKAAAWQVRPAAGTDAFVVDLPPGTYSASVLHDENANGRIDTNFLGIPTEGYGVTNNPKPRRRAARFDEATFTLPPGGAAVTVSVQYAFL